MSAREQRPTVVAIIGSPRRKGNTVALVDAALGELEHAGCDCTRITLANLRIEYCDGHVDCADRPVCAHGDDMDGVIEQVYAADGLILATPVYYEDVSAQMKTFIDRNVFPYNKERWLTPKVVGLIAVAQETGVDDTLAALRRFLALSSPEELPVVALGGLAYEPGEAAANADLMDEARAFGRAMAEKLGPAAV
jgi:multimeric flavodoxin WrbA